MNFTMTFNELTTKSFNKDDDETLDRIFDSYMTWCFNNDQPDLFGEGGDFQLEFQDWFMKSLTCRELFELKRR